MSLFTKEMMWECATKQMGMCSVGRKYAVMLFNQEDVEELYNALKQAHENIVEEYERGI